MSYNTRRTVAGGGAGAGDIRRPPTTQVNYHQQPARNMSGTTQPRNTAGYSTTPQQPATAYNSAAQPAFTTQPAYSTAPPLPKAPPQPSPAQQVKPPVISQPARPVPTTPIVVKPEPITPQGTPQSTPKMDSQENGEGSPKKEPHWKKRTFVKVPTKVRKARMNARLRRILIPKSALNFLHELRPNNYVFNVTQEPGWGFTAVCEVDGKSFTGHGMSVAKARLEAAEMALKNIMMEELAKAPTPGSAVKEELDSNAEGDSMDVGEDESDEPKRKRPKKEEDYVPWCSLAAFALHKLFDDWQKDGSQLIAESMEKLEGGEEDFYSRRPNQDFFRGPGGPRTGNFGPGPRPPFPPGSGRGRGFGPFSGPPRGYPRGFGMPRRPPAAANFLAHFGSAPKHPHPAKKIPEDAASRMHPVMLLHQLKPEVEYSVTQEGFVPNQQFVMTVQVDNNQYSGRGKNKKEAKKQAAIAALAPLGYNFPKDG